MTNPTQERSWIGEKFGAWEVIGISHRDAHRQLFLFCKCACGDIHVRRSDSINGDKSTMCPNCRWATPTVQANNKRGNRLVTIMGETKTMAEWARHAGLNYFAFRSRVDKGCPESQLLKPVAERVKRHG